MAGEFLYRLNNIILDRRRGFSGGLFFHRTESTSSDLPLDGMVKGHKIFFGDVEEANSQIVGTGAVGPPGILSIRPHLLYRD